MEGNHTLAENLKLKKWVAGSAALGFLAFMLYLFFFTNFRQVAAVVGRTNAVIYALAFPFVIVASAFDALAWIFTLDSLSVKTTFNKIFGLSWVGHFVDTLIPGGLAGDAFKTYLLTKEKNVNASKAIASIVVKDVIELLVVFGTVVVGIVLLATNYTLSSTVLTAIGITMLLIAIPLILILYLSINVSATEKFFLAIQRVYAKIKGKDTAKIALSEKLHSQITEFHNGITSMKSKPSRMIAPIACQSLAWVFELLAFYVVFLAAGSFVGLDKVVITNTIVSNVQGQGVALAGISQIVSSELYRVMGISTDLAAASSLLGGFVSFWFKLVLSFGFFQWIVFEHYIPGKTALTHPHSG